MQGRAGRENGHLRSGWWRLVVCCLVVGSALVAREQASRAQGLGWQVVATGSVVPDPRSQYGMAADGNGHIYLYGGTAASGAPLGDFWVFDTMAATWQALPNNVAPPLIEPHLAVDAQGQVWEFGGIGNPQAAHMTPDGHSFGLYEYQPALGVWHDMTPGYAILGQDWPPGREDFGLAFDPRANNLVVFGGETQDDAVLNDMWTFDQTSGVWTQVSQQYADSQGVAIAPREIYNLSADTQGHLYLFGGAYLASPDGAGVNAYANDLWRFDDSDQTWTLLAGVPNGFDPSMPLPRHYYGQTVDAAGDFDIMGGYLDAPETPPFFLTDFDASAAIPFQFGGAPLPGAYGLSDFWQYDPATGWHDSSADLGVLAGSPMIPYGMVYDQLTNRLYSFGGYHLGPDDLLDPSDQLWSLDEDAPAPPATETETDTPTDPPTPSATSTPSPSPTATPSPTPRATSTARPIPSPTPQKIATATPHPITPAKAGATAKPTASAPDPRAIPEPTTVSKTAMAGPYKVVLIVGPFEPIYTASQAAKLRPRAGEIEVGGAGETQETGFASTARHLELYVYSRTTGAPITNAALAITIIPAGKAPRQVPLVYLRHATARASDDHVGNNLVLPTGHFKVIARVEQETASFSFS